MAWNYTGYSDRAKDMEQTHTNALNDYVILEQNVISISKF